MTKDEALAFDLALDALREDRAWLESDAPTEIWEKNNEAITAIKQARALDKKAENARELGLDYEPVTTLFGSLPVYDTPPVQEDWGPGPHECHSLTASVQEPVAWRYRGILHDFDPSDWAEGPVTPLYTTPPAQPAPVQEPVAWMHTMIDDVVIGHRPADLNRHPERWMPLYKDPTPCQTCQALARTVMMDQTAHDTTPPAAQRQWVGLTDAEVMQTMSGDWTSQFYFARAIEAKLRSKNNG